MLQVELDSDPLVEQRRVLHASTQQLVLDYVLYLDQRKPLVLAIDLNGLVVRRVDVAEDAAE